MSMLVGWRNGLAAVLCGVLAAASPAVAADDPAGGTSIFDGKTLDGWDGNPELWSVRDGEIVGQTTPEKPTKGNTFLVWKGGDVGDFELTLDYSIDGGNSGIQYRSFEVPNEKWVIGGYQADIDSGDTYSGINYGERFRGILANRGQKTVVENGGKVKVVEQFAESKDLQSKVNKKGWNHYKITAKGFTFTHELNGTVMSVCTDDDAKTRRATGLLALQLHAGPPMTVRFKNLMLKRLGGDAAKSEKAKSEKKTSDAGGAKKIVFVAGGPSHGYGAHEHKAGCMLLAASLEKSGLPVETQVVTNGWPKDESVFDGADAVVIYSDGGGGHPANAHLDTLKKLEARGVGIVCLHYGVEVPKGASGDAFLDAIGGYFETDWSVNPHWTASFDSFPDSPITRGVKPFKIQDEWYYHMRFRPEMAGVTPILTDLPSPDTLSRPDGSHSGNPAVRKAVANKEPQAVAWAYERPDGGRGFGFTGGHDHWNWGNDSFRKLVLNAIVWAAHGTVPDGGVPTQPVTVKNLEANQDEPTPANFNPARIQAMLDQWNR